MLKYISKKHYEVVAYLSTSYEQWYLHVLQLLLSLGSLADRTGTEWKANLTLIQSSVFF